MFATATSEPPTGTTVRLNNATQSSATKVWVTNQTYDGIDVVNFLTLVAVGDRLTIQDRDDPTRIQRYDVTSPPGRQDRLRRVRGRVGLRRVSALVAQRVMLAVVMRASPRAGGVRERHARHPGRGMYRSPTSTAPRRSRLATSGLHLENPVTPRSPREEHDRDCLRPPFIATHRRRQRHYTATDVTAGLGTSPNGTLYVLHHADNNDRTRLSRRRVGPDYATLRQRPTSAVAGDPISDAKGDIDRRAQLRDTAAHRTSPAGTDTHVLTADSSATPSA